MPQNETNELDLKIAQFLAQVGQMTTRDGLRAILLNPEIAKVLNNYNINQGPLIATGHFFFHVNLSVWQTDPGDFIGVVWWSCPISISKAEFNYISPLVDRNLFEEGDIRPAEAVSLKLTQKTLNEIMTNVVKPRMHALFSFYENQFKETGTITCHKSDFFSWDMDVSTQVYVDYRQKQELVKDQVVVMYFADVLTEWESDEHFYAWTAYVSKMYLSGGI